jgi:hypothetical protein
LLRGPDGGVLQQAPQLAGRQFFKPRHVHAPLPQGYHSRMTDRFDGRAREWQAAIRYGERELADDSTVQLATLKAWQRPPEAPEARSPTPDELDAVAHAVERQARKLQRIARQMRREAALRRVPREKPRRVLPDLLTCRRPDCGARVPKGKPFAQHVREHRIADQRA